MFKLVVMLFLGNDAPTEIDSFVTLDQCKDSGFAWVVRAQEWSERSGIGGPEATYGFACQPREGLGYVHMGPLPGNTSPGPVLARAGGSVSP